MKILYLTPSHIDYLSDQLYTGLCKTLGWESVIDYPYKKHYHDPQWQVRPLPQNPGRPYESEEIISKLKQHEFDCVVLSAIRKEALDPLHTLSRTCTLPPLILVDGDDGIEVNKFLFQQYGFALYFKREYLSLNNVGLGTLRMKYKVFGLSQNIADRTYPLPFSAILEGIPELKMQEQNIDISFVGLASHRNRIRAVKLLGEATDLRFTGTVFAEPTTRKSKLALGIKDIFKAKVQGDPYATDRDQKGKLSYEDYFELLAQSKMALSIRGAGFDTVRYWEIVASKRLLVSETPYIHIPHNFEHGKHALFCRPDLSDLVDIVRASLKDEACRQSMIEQAYQHLLRYHTCEQRAKQFLEICRTKL